MNSSRLLVLCHGYPPYYGGGEHVAAYLAEAAVRAGHVVQVVTSDIGGRLPPQELRGGVQIHRVPSPKRVWTRHTAPELLAFLLRARAAMPRLLEHVRPDYILAHFTVPSGELARFGAGRSGVPYAVVLHGSDVPGYQSDRFGLLYPMLKPLARRTWRGARCVIAVSEELRSLALRSWPGGRIDVIPNGVDVARFASAARARVSAGAGHLRVAVTAQLIERKGLDVLIDAVAVLPSAERAGVVVDIYGTGPQAESLAARARMRGVAGQIKFHGLLEHENLPDALARADAFVLPSLQEGLPLALLEAMASGLPVVASRVGGIPDVVVDGESGFLAEPGAVPALAAALQKLLADPALRENMGRAAAGRMVALSWDRTWQRYEACLNPGVRA